MTPTTALAEVTGMGEDEYTAALAAQLVWTSRAAVAKYQRIRLASVLIVAAVVTALATGCLF